MAGQYTFNWPMIGQARLQKPSFGCKWPASCLPELHRNPDQKFINMMSASRWSFCKLDPVLDGQVTTCVGLKHPGPTKINVYIWVSTDFALLKHCNQSKNLCIWKIRPTSSISRWDQIAFCITNCLFLLQFHRVNYFQAKFLRFYYNIQINSRR